MVLPRINKGEYPLKARIGKWVYNPLNKIVRRIDKEMAYLTVSMTMIAVGFILFTWGIDRTDELARNAGAMIIGLAIIWIVVFTMLLSFVESKHENIPNYFLKILFEVASAFGTVGLSAGITPILSSFGKMLIMITMFVGRVGPLTLALALSVREQKVFYKYPEEKIMVG